MSDLIETINQLRNDLQPLTISREHYLALLVKDRLDLRSKRYNDDFQALLSVLERDYYSETKIKKLTKSLKVYSQTSAIIYKSLIKQLKNYQKNLFNQQNL